MMERTAKSSPPSECTPVNLSQILEIAAKHKSQNGIRFYQPGSHGSSSNNVSVRLTYQQLFEHAKIFSQAVRRHLARFKDNAIVILHFNTQYENIIWFWSVVLAGYIPCVSVPLSNDLRQRKEYLLHLDKLFNHPLILTTSAQIPAFSSVDQLNIQAIEYLELKVDDFQPHHENPGFTKNRNDLAAVMLTSGSSGNSKGVIHLHGQILDSIIGKSEYHKVTHDHVFLTWIGLDHDANLTETHLQAMNLVAEQIHVHKDDVTNVLCDGPLLFLKLLSLYRVAHTFAPNAFLDAIRIFLTERATDATPLDLDLSCLRNFISGGERNVVSSVATLTSLLKIYGAPENFIRPGFGMTETCAGSIYSRDCPRLDIAADREHAMLGSCIPGIQMRIVTDNDKPVPANIPGNLQVAGSIVTPGYYNNPEANSDAFSEDGWFRTGDIALINSAGHLILTGRAKMNIIINGVHHYPFDIEAALDEAKIPGLTPGYNVVFAHRPTGAATEVICMVYLPTYDTADIKSHIDTLDAISKVIIIQTGSRPYRAIPLPIECLQKSSLGKLSNKKVTKAFETGIYDQYLDNEAVKEFRNIYYVAPSNDREEKILDIFKTYETSEDNFGIDSNLFEIGVDSIKLIQFQSQLQTALSLPYKLGMADILANPTPRLLAKKLALEPDHGYNPLVILRSGGAKTPLWLIHPGMGEILIFLQLARYFEDRPVYALRPRGLDGDEHFNDIQDVVQSYYQAIKKVQPSGPYAIAGYSFGGSMAFEVTKLIEKDGGRVKLLGIFDQPPQLRDNSIRFDWYGCLTALSTFLGLLKNADQTSVLQSMRKLKPSRPEAISMIIARTTQERMAELEITNEKLENWAGTAYRLKEIGRTYDPIGKVESMDVFYTVFRPYRAENDDDWLQNHLGEWKEHVRQEVGFHFCEGTHYDMVTTHVASFQKKIKALLTVRGI